MPQPPTPATIEAIVGEFRGRQGVLLHIFHRLQEAFGYVPQEAMEPVAEALRLHPSTVYGTLTFYSELRTEPPAPIEVRMCLGPTCHLRGAEVVKEVLEYRLGVPHGSRRSASGDVEIREVECAGHCHLAPLLYVNGEPNGPVEIAAAAALADRVRGLVRA